MADIDDGNFAHLLATPDIDRQTGLPLLLAFYGDVHALMIASAALTLVLCCVDSPSDSAGVDVARVLRDCLADDGRARVYRTADDTFAMTLPGRSRDEGLRLAERLRARIVERTAHTASLCVASAPEDADGIGELIASAELMMALRSQGNTVYSALDLRALAPQETRLAALLAARVQTLVELGARLYETERQAFTDPVTGLPNSRSLQQALPRYLERCQRDGVPLALVLIDGDSLKDFNTRLGYEAGNRWIRTVAQALYENLRPGDYIARWFVGDEFVVLLPDTSLPCAMEIADRLRLAVETAGRRTAGFGSISAGVVVGGGDAEALLDAARDALVLAKDRGKNQVAALAEH